MLLVVCEVLNVKS